MYSPAFIASIKMNEREVRFMSYLFFPILAVADYNSGIFLDDTLHMGLFLYLFIQIFCY
jgi:hypothetical protein